PLGQFDRTARKHIRADSMRVAHPRQRVAIPRARATRVGFLYSRHVQSETSSKECPAPRCQNRRQLLLILKRAHRSSTKSCAPLTDQHKQRKDTHEELDMTVVGMIMHGVVV